jgi:Flp pilus assembly protein TadG
MPVGGAMSMQRGQALIETAIFMPLFLFLLFSVLYFGNVGVKQERMQGAVRYGITTDAAVNLKIEQLYAAYQTFPGPLNSPANNNNVNEPLSPGTCSSTQTSQTLAALNQAQTIPTAAPSTQPWWQVSSPTDTCGTIFLPTSNLPDMLNTPMSYVDETTNQLTAIDNAPNLMSTLLPKTYHMAGFYAGFQPASIQEMIGCMIEGSGGHGKAQTGPGMAMAIAEALGPSGLPTSKPNTTNLPPYYNGYDTTNYTGDASKLCNKG